MFLSDSHRSGLGLKVCFSPKGAEGSAIDIALIKMGGGPDKTGTKRDVLFNQTITMVKNTIQTRVVVRGKLKMLRTTFKFAQNHQARGSTGDLIKTEFSSGKKVSDLFEGEVSG